ncbi:MAG: hypothetical protein COU08_01265 [Candidatus Harrisonbacteria bacterium CG10_big_fil_rev_8_21_14_0_10_42_17]|uniref:Uncharacterized protein n=1 Tax=Candidatus Harrisonbacteria bacterium CG10_big_fil_rev_8_21_14_0_10_42_17 TaxID=1974584 RepID=A0A2M6WII4_9BACT|nr:MAG: hypothetical protein COU08_01265 [Candidatus Harrisonbacteria bacterium CG10_big_fil_rev_8_21_14_0_10_42_17]
MSPQPQPQPQPQPDTTTKDSSSKKGAKPQKPHAMSARLQRFTQFAKQLLKSLNPEPLTGGLEISEAALRYAIIKDRKLVTKTVQLAPGVIQNGQIQDKQRFVTALTQLRTHIGEPKLAIYVIALLPPDAVYTQTFSIPNLDEARLHEAAGLNMQMLSPIDPESAYMSWERLGLSESGENQVDFLGAASSKDVVRVYLESLREAGFSVIAAEFPALSASRLITRLSESTSPSYFVIQLTGDGLLLMILRSNRLYFTRFVSFKELGVGEKGQVDAKAFNDLIVRECHQVLNFHSSRWGHALNDVVVVTEQLNERIGEIIRTTFSLPVRDIRIQEFPNLSVLWWPALGAALRGLTPRSRDESLSLTPGTVQAGYWQDRFLIFLALWRKILIFSFAFILIIFIGVDVFLRVTERRIDAASFNIPSSELVDVTALQDEARVFNALVTKASFAYDAIPNWSPFFDRLLQIAGSAISFDRLTVSPQGVQIAARTLSQVSAIAFKNTLEKEPNFSNVVLPLANINVNTDNSVQFEITFDITSLQFQ